MANETELLAWRWGRMMLFMAAVLALFLSDADNNGPIFMLLLAIYGAVHEATLYLRQLVERWP